MSRGPWLHSKFSVGTGRSRSEQVGSRNYWHPPLRTPPPPPPPGRLMLVVNFMYYEYYYRLVLYRPVRYSRALSICTRVLPPPLRQLARGAILEAGGSRGTLPTSRDPPDVINLSPTSRDTSYSTYWGKAL